VQTPYARVFGIPNSLLGIIYYLLVILWATAPRSFSLLWALIGAGVATVLLGFYLIYSLLYELRTHCPLCYMAHAVNAALLVLLILASRSF
jgi:uncharacterized membrane protein